jgi:cytochrome c peroxidase
MRAYLVALCLGTAVAAQGGLPPQPVPSQNPITPQKAILGKLLFWEEQLSSNNRVACGTCHTFGAGGGDLRRAVNPGPDGITPSADDKFGSPGVIRSDALNDYSPDPMFGLSPQVGARAAPSVLTAAWFPDLFWDGRASTTFVDPQTSQVTIPSGGALESQALGPIRSNGEMAHDQRLWSEVTSKLQTAMPMALATNLPPDMAYAIAGGRTYPDLFQAAFGSPAITPQRIAYALATYQRTLVPDQTPWDLYMNGQLNAMTPQQINGWNIFNGPARCSLCHVPGLFSDTQFRNLGLRPIGEDNGRQAITNDVGDRGKFKVPSLRNAGLRTSFMHDGSLGTLLDVFNFYVAGGGSYLDNVDPLLVPMNLPAAITGDFIDFLANGLTDPRVALGLYPFDRPTLHSDVMGPTGYPYGAGTAGSGGLVPELLAEVPANLGNVDFKLGLGNARGGAFAALAVGLLPGTGSTLGANLSVDLHTATVFYIGLSGTTGTAGAGYGTLRLPLPVVSGFVATTVYAQGFVFDLGAPGGLASTAGAEIRLF